VKIPTIGIGAGRDCDGQVLVTHDMVGLFDGFTPKFVKQYTQVRQPIVDALQEYKNEVEAGTFPEDQHSFTMRPEEMEKLGRLE